MRTLLAAALFVAPHLALAQQTGIQVDNVWSRAALGGHQGAIYLTITDTGEPDSLIGAATPVAAKAELHQSFNDNGVMKMRPVAALPVEPGKPLTLAPGGYHIMLMDLKAPLQQGDSFPVTLSFAKAGQVTATAMVQKAGASAPAMDHGAMGDMQHNMSMPPQTGSKQP